MSIEALMPSNHLVLCLPFLLLPSIFPSIRVFSKELALCIPFLPSLKSPFHAETGSFYPKHIYYCLNFLSLLAWPGLLWLCQWAAGAVKRRKCQSCHSLGQLTKATKWMSSIASLLEFVCLVKMNKLLFFTKLPPPQSFQDPKLCEFISIYHSSHSVLLSHFFFSLFIQSPYTLPHPQMWISLGHVLLCLWLLVITFAYVFAHCNVINLRRRSCNRSYQEWHHVVLFLRGSFLNSDLSFL